MIVRLAWKLFKKLSHFFEVWHTQGFHAAGVLITEKVHPTLPKNPTDWWRTYRPTPTLLEKFRACHWSSSPPKITVLVPVFNTPTAWLVECLNSVLNQTYPHWQCVVIDDCSTLDSVQVTLQRFAQTDPRFKIGRSETNVGVCQASNLGLTLADGEYVLFLDHDDALEPHALHRFVEAILAEQYPELLYADEAITTTDLEEILAIRSRCAFSWDYYWCHPYFVHPVAIRRAILSECGGFDEVRLISQDVDLILRVLEKSQRVTHIPDVLYRWRTHSKSLGHQAKKQTMAATQNAVESHLSRLGLSARVMAHTTQFNVLQVSFPVKHGSRVAIIIPTKNRVDLLQACVESVLKTVSADLADLVIIDHASDEPETLAYLELLARQHRVLRYAGPFNFAAMNNFAVQQISNVYSHYLFLNNDVIAPVPGWLDSMLGLCCRGDIGSVGAVLIYPDNTIQHAGIVLGLLGGVDHAYRGRSFSQNAFHRQSGENCELVCTRDYAAVTAACQLVRAEVFAEVGGFDERYRVGMNDVDLGLRIRHAGWKVLTDANAVLIHSESQSRGREDRHPEDTQQFLQQYQDLLHSGDIWTSPHWDPSPLMNVWRPRYQCPEVVHPRTVVLWRTD